MMRRYFACALAIVCVGCGGGETSRKSSQERASEITRSADEKAVTGRAESNLGLPKGWPSEIVVYPGLKILTSVASPDGLIVTGTTSSSAENVATYFKGQLEKVGWTNNMDLKTPDGAMLTFTRSDDLGVNIILEEGTKGLMVTMVVNKVVTN